MLLVVVVVVVAAVVAVFVAAHVALADDRQPTDFRIEKHACIEMAQFPFPEGHIPTILLLMLMVDADPRMTMTMMLWLGVMTFPRR